MALARNCMARLKVGTTTLAPLPKKALIRDLVTEIAPPDERLERWVKTIRSTQRSIRAEAELSES